MTPQEIKEQAIREFEEKFNNISTAVVTITTEEGFNEQKPAQDELKSFLSHTIDQTYKEATEKYMKWLRDFSTAMALEGVNLPPDLADSQGVHMAIHDKIQKVREEAIQEMVEGIEGFMHENARLGRDAERQKECHLLPCDLLENHLSSLKQKLLALIEKK